jgi:hypothetical protein
MFLKGRTSGLCLGLISTLCITSICQQTNGQQRGSERANEPVSPTSAGDFGKGRPASDVKSGEEASKPGVHKPSDYPPTTPADVRQDSRRDINFRPVKKDTKPR